MSSESVNLFQSAFAALTTENISEKIKIVEELDLLWNQNRIQMEDFSITDIHEPVRPQNLQIVSQKNLPARKLATEEGHAAFLHALTHIEFEAIHLALDVLFRFRKMPEAFYEDWISLCLDECRHFELLNNHLQALGFNYGDFTVHGELWELSRLCRHSVLERMAIVPRMAEARGLDVAPSMQKKLRKIGYHETADKLLVIYKDEIGHVKTGSRWFQYLCNELNLNSAETYISILKKYGFTQIRKPLNREARLLAGFTEDELNYFETFC